MKLQKTKKGFTLIELLVVITIIGILATGAVSVYSSQIQKARDTTRISDVNTLKGGIEQYYQDTFVYPSGSVDWETNASDVDVQDYVPNLAEDPKHDQTCNGSRCGYVYTVGPDTVGITDGSYEVSTAFENQANVNTKAKASSDNGEDDARLELGSLKTTTSATDLVTVSAQTTAFSANDATSGDATIVIVKNNTKQK